MLGLDLVVDQNACRIYKVAEDLSGLRTPGSMRAGRAPILTFVTEEVDEVYEIFMQSGVKVTSEPKSNEKYGIYISLLKTPRLCWKSNTSRSRRRTAFQALIRQTVKHHERIP